MLIKNNSELNIVNYPIKGEKFSIKAGETLDMREDAAIYIMYIYQFITRADGDKKPVKKPLLKDVLKLEKIEVKEAMNKEAVEEVKEGEEDYGAMSYRDLQKMYTEKSGKKAIGMKKEELMEALKSL